MSMDSWAALLVRDGTSARVPESLLWMKSAGYDTVSCPVSFLPVVQASEYFLLSLSQAYCPLKVRPLSSLLVEKIHSTTVHCSASLLPKETHFVL